MSENAVKELKVTKRIDPDRIGRVLKQNSDSMQEMDAKSLQTLIQQAEIDMKRCSDGGTVLYGIASQLADVMLAAVEVAEARGIRIP